MVSTGRRTDNGEFRVKRTASIRAIRSRPTPPIPTNPFESVPLPLLTALSSFIFSTQTHTHTLAFSLGISSPYFGCISDELSHINTVLYFHFHCFKLIDIRVLLLVRERNCTEKWLIYVLIDVFCYASHTQRS